MSGWEGGWVVAKRLVGELHTGSVKGRGGGGTLLPPAARAPPRPPYCSRACPLRLDCSSDTLPGRRVSCHTLREGV